MAKLAKSVKDIKKQILEMAHVAVEDVLQNEVFEVVREVVLDHIAKDVYGAGEPSPGGYKRRSDNRGDHYNTGGQGLGDSNNIVFELEGRQSDGQSKTLVVWNIAKLNPRNRKTDSFSDAVTRDKSRLLQTIIIDGWSNPRQYWQQPRPFIENARKTLQRGGENRQRLGQAFETGMKRHGFIKLS